jgi:hypothetical protein
MRWLDPQRMPRRFAIRTVLLGIGLALLALLARGFPAGLRIFIGAGAAIELSLGAFWFRITKRMSTIRRSRRREIR